MATANHTRPWVRLLAGSGLAQYPRWGWPAVLPRRPRLPRPAITGALVSNGIRPGARTITGTGISATTGKVPATSRLGTVGTAAAVGAAAATSTGVGAAGSPDVGTRPPEFGPASTNGIWTPI